MINSWLLWRPNTSFFFGRNYNELSRATRRDGTVINRKSLVSRRSRRDRSKDKIYRFQQEPDDSLNTRHKLPATREKTTRATNDTRESNNRKELTATRRSIRWSRFERYVETACFVCRASHPGRLPYPYICVSIYRGIWHDSRVFVFSDNRVGNRSRVEHVPFGALMKRKARDAVPGVIATWHRAYVFSLDARSLIKSIISKISFDFQTITKKFKLTLLKYINFHFVFITYWLYMIIILFYVYNFILFLSIKKL